MAVSSKEAITRMFASELKIRCTVSSKLNASSVDNSFRKKRRRSGIEEIQLNSLAEISRMTTLVPCEDRYVWTLESDGVFSVASIRKEIDGNRFQDVSLPTRWVKSVPIKVNIIAWKVKSNALPTRFNISRRGMDIDSIVCPICNAGVESTNHIFFQCVVVRQIMRKISSWWNIDYSDVNSYEEWVSFGWFLFGFNPNSKAFLRVYTMVCGGICGTFATSFCLIRRSLKRR
ncbi:RNA-directed DNA polymerase, eukaryota [Tanacetum coccineum]